MSSARVGSYSGSVNVGSIGELVKTVRAISDEAGVPLWYRGQADVEWNVEPAVRRGYSIEEERNFTNRFRARAAVRYSPTPIYDDWATWLSLMQHYGLPTRLLDWTRSPLIAAYFALETNLTDSGANSGKSGAIWVLFPHVMNATLDFDPLVTPPIDANMCRQMLQPAFKSGTENGKVAAVMAAETDLRMYVQQGCFTIHSSSVALNLNPESDKFLRRLVIDPSAGVEMARNLALCGFKRGELFPDLANLADELKAFHPPGGVK